MRIWKFRERVVCLTLPPERVEPDGAWAVVPVAKAVLAAWLTAQLKEKLGIPGLAISSLHNVQELSSCLLIDKE